MQHVEKITAIKIYQKNRYCGITTYITKSFQTSGKTDNFVQELMTDKPQLVLINTLISTIF